MLRICLIAAVLAGLCPAGAKPGNAECLHSAVTAKAVVGAAWASYTLQLPGHEGERCWYPTTKARRHFHVKDQPVSEVMPHRSASKSGPHDARPRAAGSLLPPGAVVDLYVNLGRWHGEHLAVMPEADPHFVHLMLGDNLNATWEAVYAGRERLAAPPGLEVAAVGWPSQPSQKADSLRLTSIWIARQDVFFP